MSEYLQIGAFDNYLLAHMTLGLLKDNGIDCHFKDEHIVTVDPFLNNAVGGIKLLVAPADMERARSLIKEAEADYLKNIACPRCGNHTLVAEENTDTPTGMLGKLKNMLLFGQTSTYEKVYRCSSCHLAVKDLPAPEYEDTPGDEETQDQPGQ
jgi:DNA-directed RNA polymerase subunit RPC12/RpoP